MSSKKKCVISSPGPKYCIDSKVTRYGKDGTPAYSMLGRRKEQLLNATSSPGPCHYIDSKITRHGKDGTPAYSMLGRRKEQKLFQTPGPGAYSPEKAPPCNLERRAPSYTMSSRTLYRGINKGPAPNQYSLPPVIGPQVPHKQASASYSLSGRFKAGGPCVDLAKTPGPCAYNSTDPSIYLRRQPAFSMLGRHALPRDTTEMPGPGAYYPERVTVNKARAPAFFLGIRHSEFVAPLIENVLD